jgi:CheY-like chemotaxis protein
VEDAHSALEALAQAEVEGRAFRLILLDGHMPKMDGFALAEQMQKQSHLMHAVVMMLTSPGHLGDGGRCRALGIFAYLVKPIRQRELLDAICQVLGAGPQVPTFLWSRVTVFMKESHPSGYCWPKITP